MIQIESVGGVRQVFSPLVNDFHDYLSNLRTIERDVIALTMDGLSIPEISRKLGLPSRNVEYVLFVIYKQWIHGRTKGAASDRS